MPYGIDKKIGGDSKENVSWMEKCVSSIKGNNKRTGKPYTKGEKIAICKAQLKKGKASHGMVDDLTFTQLENAKERYINSTVAALNVSKETAEAMFEIHIIRNNYLF